jgi:ATP:ADP antiporter, AAA family
VSAGTVQNILSKATKYAFFDPTKEMAYIPLDQNAKVRWRYTAGQWFTGAEAHRGGSCLAGQGQGCH